MSKEFGFKDSDQETIGFWGNVGQHGIPVEIHGTGAAVKG